MFAGKIRELSHARPDDQESLPHCPGDVLANGIPVERSGVWLGDQLGRMEGNAILPATARRKEANDLRVHSGITGL